MTLRDAVIQVLRPWVENSPKSYYYDDALSAALDALLDFLVAEGWVKALPEIFLEQQPDRLIDTPRGKVPNLLGPGSVTNVRIVNHLVAALRGTTE